MPLIEPGRSERELQVALEAAFLRNGGDFLGFESIVAAGDHAAVLHFTPTARALNDGDLVLVDAGAECRGYVSDVTRTYAVGGAFTPEQALVYETVRQAGEAAIEVCRPGVEWREVHRAAALVVADGLVEFGVLRGRRESLVESGAVTLFFPHGIGHMVGLGVRDTGPASDETREPAPGLPRLRVDIPLAPRQPGPSSPVYTSWRRSRRGPRSRRRRLGPRRPAERLRRRPSRAERADRRRRLRGPHRGHPVRTVVERGSACRPPYCSAIRQTVVEPAISLEGSGFGHASRSLTPRRRKVPLGVCI